MRKWLPSLSPDRLRRGRSGRVAACLEVGIAAPIRILQWLALALAVHAPSLAAQGSCSYLFLNRGRGEALVQRAVAVRSAPLRQHGYHVAASRTGWLCDRRDETVQLALNPGMEHVVVAVCGEDCSRLGLILRDQDGAIVAADTTPGSRPTLRFTTSSVLRGSHASVLQVHMGRCRAAACAYAVHTLELAPAPGAIQARQLRATLQVTHAEPRSLPVRIDSTHRGYTPVTLDVPAGQVLVHVGSTAICVRTAPRDTARVALTAGRIVAIRSAALCDDPAAPPARPDPRDQATAPGAAAAVTRAAPADSTVPGRPPDLPPLQPHIGSRARLTALSITEQAGVLRPAGSERDSVRPTRFTLTFQGGPWGRSVVIDVSAYDALTPQGEFLIARVENEGGMFRRGDELALPYDSAGIPRPLQDLGRTGATQPLHERAPPWFGGRLPGDIQVMPLTAFEFVLARGLGTCLELADRARRGGAALGVAMWTRDSDGGLIERTLPAPPVGSDSDLEWSWLPGRFVMRELLEISRVESGETRLRTTFTALPANADSASARRTRAAVNEDRHECRFAPDGALLRYDRTQEVYDYWDLTRHQVWSTERASRLEH